MHSAFLSLVFILAVPILVSGTPSGSPACPDMSAPLRAVKLAFEDAKVSTRNFLTSFYCVLIKNTSKIPTDINTSFEPQALLGVTWPSPNTGEDPIYTYPGRHLFDNGKFSL